MAAYLYQNFDFIIVPLLICMAQIFVVTVGTLRIMFISKNNKMLATALGFFEVLMWLLAVGGIVTNIDKPIMYIAYATGFAIGNYIGIYLEEKIAMGTLIVRIVTKNNAMGLINSLKENEYNITSMMAEDNHGNVHVIYSIIHRAGLGKILSIIRSHDEKAYYSVEDIRFVSGEINSIQKSSIPVNIDFFKKIFRKKKFKVETGTETVEYAGGTT